MPPLSTISQDSTQGKAAEEQAILLELGKRVRASQELSLSSSGNAGNSSQVDLPSPIPHRPHGTITRSEDVESDSEADDDGFDYLADDGSNALLDTEPMSLLVDGRVFGFETEKEVELPRLPSNWEPTWPSVLKHPGGQEKSVSPEAISTPLDVAKTPPKSLPINSKEDSGCESDWETQEEDTTQAGLANDVNVKGNGSQEVSRSEAKLKLLGSLCLINNSNLL